jgi:hypothetical protein
VLVAGAVLGVRAMRGAAVGDDGSVALPRPVNLSSLVAADWSAGDVGDCLVQLPDTAELSVVGCDQPHDLQRFASGSVTTAHEAMAATVDSACEAAFEQFVGSAPADSQLEIAASRPSPASWDQGDRRYQCYLGKQGQRLTGDARQSVG